MRENAYGSTLCTYKERHKLLVQSSLDHRIERSAAQEFQWEMGWVMDWAKRAACLLQK